MATSMCIQCVEYLCPICSDGHTKYNTRTMGHKVASLDNVRDGRFLKEIQEHQRSFCRKHKNEDIKLFCLPCQKTICILCKTLDHDDHKVASLEDAANKVSDELKALSKQVSSKIPIIQKVFEEKIKLKDVIHIESEATQKQVKEWSKREKDNIQNTKKKLLEELQQSENILIKEACTAAEEAESLLATIKSTVEYTQGMTEHANDTVKLQQFQELNSRLEELKKIDIPAPTRSMKPSFALAPANLPMLIANEQTLVLHQGKLISSFSVKLQGEEEPRCCGITVDGTTVYTTDWKNKKVKAFNRTGQFQYLVGDGKIGHPIDITTDKQGRLMLTDYTKRSLTVFNINQEHILTVENLYGETGYVGTNSKNEIIIADNKNQKLSVLEPNGNACRSIESNCVLGADTFTPKSIATNMNDDMIVSDQKSKCIHILDGTDSRLHVYKPEGTLALKFPSGVCVDIWGNILVVDNTDDHKSKNSRGRVHLVSSAGVHLALVVTENDGLKYSTGISICGPGEFVVLEWKGCVKRYKYLDIYSNHSVQMVENCCVHSSSQYKTA